MYNILVVDNSALMRKLMCDIINETQEFTVVDKCSDVGVAFHRVQMNKFDAITLNVAMESSNQKSLTQQLMENGYHIPVIAITYAIKEDRELTMAAFESGVVEFVIRPFQMTQSQQESFKTHLLEALHVAVHDISNHHEVLESTESFLSKTTKYRFSKAEKSKVSVASTEQFGLIAIACSTGGPQALHTFIPMLPAHIGVPVVIVQHMPAGFTASLAERLNLKSALQVKEAEDNELLLPDWVYIAPGGKHLSVVEDSNKKLRARVLETPPVRNLRPSADVMFESLEKLSIQKILCVVLTGMGSDGTIGLFSLQKKKEIYVITEQEDSCVVYGMPKAIVEAGLSNEEQSINKIAEAIIKKLGV